jgi:ParB family transcriptional regulator, chromosome partitioning protein
MTQTEKRRSLGRGLSALIPPRPVPQSSQAATETRTTEVDKDSGLLELSVDEILPGDGQPRQIFDESAIQELAASIEKHGILQPLVVRQKGPHQYELIAGERRWRAAQKVGLKKVRAVVSDAAPEDTLTLALVENLQREDLNPMEEAEAFYRLHNDLGYSQGEIAEAVGKDRTTIANALRLLKLPSKIQEMVLVGELTMGHARALLALDGPRAMERMARQIHKKSWSVRDTERAVTLAKKSKTPRSKKPDPKKTKESSSERDLRLRIQRTLGTKVEINQKDGNGTIALHFASYDEMDALLEKICGS